MLESGDTTLHAGVTPRPHSLNVSTSSIACAYRLAASSAVPMDVGLAFFVGFPVQHSVVRPHLTQIGTPTLASDLSFRLRG